MKKKYHSIDYSSALHDYYYKHPLLDGGMIRAPVFTPPIQKPTDEPDIESELDAIVTRIEYSKLARDLRRQTDDDYINHLRKKDKLTREEIYDGIIKWVLWVFALIAIGLVGMALFFLITN